MFTDIGAGLQGVDYSALDWGDYDNDGDLDLIVMGRYFDSPFFGSDLASSTIYRNDGGGVFTDIVAGLLPLNNGSVNWGDYDGDGDLDLVMTGFDGAWSNRYSIIYDNNGGVFSDHGAGLPQVAWGDTDWGDYDNDGDLDLLLSGDGVGPTITSIFNNTGGVFTDINAGLPTTSEGSVRWGDFNGDGNLDLILTGNDYSTSTEITHIFRNDGGNVFTDINAGLQTVYFTGLADWGDFDGDGDLDILVAGESTIDPTSTSAILYENTTLPFITTWTTTDNQIVIPTNSLSYAYNYNVTWKNITNSGVGDGAATSQAGDLIIAGLTNGDTYQVEITGLFPAIYFDINAANAIKIRTVDQWGGINWASFNSAFRGCTNLTITASDSPDLSGVTDLSRAFMLCSNFNSNINTWDVSNVTDFSLMFYEAFAFNQPLGLWDVGNAIDMSYMFENANTFNQDIGLWNVANVTNIRNMFSGANLFNQDIGAWDVGSVTNFNSMFLTAVAFNQDISGWNVSSGNSFRFMFEDASSFNQNLGSWDISNATNLGSMLSGTALSVSNYDQTLIGWEALATTPTFQNLGASGLFYCAGETARLNLITTYNWTIDDAGQLCVGSEIAVFEGATTVGVEIFNGQAAALDFGSASQGNNLNRQFTIENQGSSTLNISSITISGTAYSLLTVPTTSLGPGISQTLDIQLSGATTGTFNETVNIISDDGDEGTFTFPITGIITAATCASPPTADAPTIQPFVNQAFNVDVLATSTINTGDIIVITILQNPTKGSVTVQANNTIDYTASTGTIGADSFEYQICNQCDLCDAAIVSVDILNAAPQFNALNTTPEVAPGQSIVISVLSIITDLNNNLDLNSFSNFSSTANADFIYNPNTGDLTLDYTNALFSSAQDNITFTICDLLNACTNVVLQVDLNGEITVFNGVSPNGDGLNDYFKIENIQFIEPTNKVSIYNRWGDRVFEMDNYNSNDPNKRFEGIQNNGTELPNGIFFYKVEFPSGRSGMEGYLTLKR